ncbi:MAG: hypothetical protein J6128_06245 [Clostridia bacterium]|nr:hypothetical protein [Clostridia bacterium]
MPKVIVKCRYYKSGSGKGLGGYMNYIATREGVEKLSNDQRTKPATEAQIEMIEGLLKENPSLKNASEYRLYSKDKTVGTASEFISHALESRPELLGTEQYLRYMATRPRVDKRGRAHGLFSSGGVDLDLDDEIKKFEAHKGNVYSVIISIKREDAQRLGYNSAERWQSMIGANIDRIAKEHHIPLTSMRWYGAFHNESHHPHVHMLLYSTEENNHAYLTKKGIDNLRHLFGTEIFKNEIYETYDRQTEIRNRITQEMRERFRRLAEELRTGNSAGKDYQEKLAALADRLNGVSGKKQYGYLPKGIKALVDEAVDVVAADERVSGLYDLWYQAKCSVYQTYTDKMPEKLPLSNENAFKAIRNALVYEAAKLGIQFRRSVPQPGGRHDVLQKLTSKSDRTRLDSIRIRSAALRFFSSLAQVFENGFSKYDPSEDEDIDRQLRREIRAVKDGIQLVM